MRDYYYQIAWSQSMYLIPHSKNSSELSIVERELGNMVNCWWLMAFPLEVFPKGCSFPVPLCRTSTPVGLDECCRSLADHNCWSTSVTGGDLGKKKERELILGKVIIINDIEKLIIIKEIERFKEKFWCNLYAIIISHSVWKFTWGIIDVSATLRFLIPWTLSRGSTTAIGSLDGPILQDPAWWFSGPVFWWIAQFQYSLLRNVYWEQADNGILLRLMLYFAIADVLAKDNAICMPSSRIAASIGSLR